MKYELKHTDTTANKIIIELSNKFSELLCEYLGGDIINKVIQDNKTTEYGCNSNDYCDANQIMIDALNYLFGENWKLSDNKIDNLINASWTMSMKNEFKQKTNYCIIDGCEDDAEHNSVMCKNCYDDCTRFGEEYNQLPNIIKKGTKND